jgi:hypothetical protein
MKAQNIEARLSVLEELVRHQWELVQEQRGQLEEQANKIQRLEDIEAIKKLQKAYGYYVEHFMHQEIIDCFADSPEVTLDWLEGRYLGKEGVRRYFMPRPDSHRLDSTFIHQVMQIAGIVDVDSDGLRAKGRWYAFGGIGTSARRSFVTGIYEVEYVKENGVWKILKLKWVIPYAVRSPGEWARPEDVNRPYYTGQWKGPTPDIPPDKQDLRYVTGYIFPFHYKHPVTGKETSEAELNAKLKPVKIE